jgi:non-heme chloroperoxidase
MTGKKPPVVMIHGAFSGPWVWSGFAGKFKKAGYEVHAPCLRHHDGKASTDPLAKVSLTDYAADLEEFLDELGAPAILVGHSMGGLLAQMLAAKKKAHAVILLAPSAPWGVPPSTLFEIASAQTMLLNVGFWDTVLAPDEHIAGGHFLDRMPDRDKVAARLVPESGRAIFEIMHWGLDMRRAGEVDDRKLTCPLLVLVGSEDRINPPSTVQRVAGLYRELATFEKVPGMSHWLVGEPGWEKVADRAIAWLADV